VRTLGFVPPRCFRFYGFLCLDGHRWRHLSYTWNGHRVRRELPVQHRTGRSSCAQVCRAGAVQVVVRDVSDNKRSLFYETAPLVVAAAFFVIKPGGAGRQQTAVRTSCRRQGVWHSVEKEEIRSALASGVEFLISSGGWLSELHLRRIGNAGGPAGAAS